MYLSPDESCLIPKVDIKSVGEKAYKDPFTKLWMEAGYFLYLRYEGMFGWVFCYYSLKGPLSLTFSIESYFQFL